MYWSTLFARVGGFEHVSVLTSEVGSKLNPRDVATYSIFGSVYSILVFAFFLFLVPSLYVSSLLSLFLYHLTLINKLRTGVSVSRFQPGCLSMSTASSPDCNYEDAPSPYPRALRASEKRKPVKDSNSYREKERQRPNE
jgi:hypothetical protein